jgi:hypothetical protein
LSDNTKEKVVDTRNYIKQNKGKKQTPKQKDSD